MQMMQIGLTKCATECTDLALVVVVGSILIAVCVVTQFIMRFPAYQNCHTIFRRAECSREWPFNDRFACKFEWQLKWFIGCYLHSIFTRPVDSSPRLCSDRWNTLCQTLFNYDEKNVDKPIVDEWNLQMRRLYVPFACVVLKEEC